ncbi:OmpA family protein [Streptomyces sp. NPDC058045]|uniref:OmpA family protein n=1 Tax=Streptomyces sp. NPDC058045 TaxID=3346311 RepID=UPI0036E2B495
MATSVVLAAGVLTAATTASADDGPSQPPGTAPSASAPVKIDPKDPDLKLPEGATLGDPKVLDIKAVIGDEGGEERREDTNSDVKYALQAEVLFGKDSAKLGSGAKARIHGVAQEIKKEGSRTVRVFGFTDNLGSAAHGDVLSKQRARAVDDVLERELGDSGITFEVRGYGEKFPIADNATEDGRKKNRRVEVSFPRGNQG